MAYRIASVAPRLRAEGLACADRECRYCLACIVDSVHSLSSPLDPDPLEPPHLPSHTGRHTAQLSRPTSQKGGSRLARSDEARWP